MNYLNNRLFIIVKINNLERIFYTMRATSIPAHEKSFYKYGIDSHGKQFILTPESLLFGPTQSALNYLNAVRDNGDTSYYYSEKVKKTKIVLHFTAGYLKGDIAQLSRPFNHVSVPFVIARDGTIIKLFSSAFWSYHLGPTASGGNKAMSSQSIGIELSNIGFLKKAGSQFVSSYSNTDVYCDQSETYLYQILDSPFRGEDTYATFTRNQYTSLAVLLRYLSHTYNIPLKLLPQEKRYKTIPSAEIKKYKGVLSHVNFRKTGKWDLGPAFDWEQLTRKINEGNNLL